MFWLCVTLVSPRGKAGSPDPALLLARQDGDDTDSTPADPLGAVADAIRDRLHEAEADEEEAVQRCRDMRALLREQSESLEAAERAADAGNGDSGSSGADSDESTEVLDDAQVAWMEDVLKFMYRYRRHIWQRNHWFPLSRQSQSGAPMTTMYTARMSADRELTAAFAALCAAAPPGVSTSLFWCEPAFWCLPVKQCSWVVGDLSTPLADQLRELDLLEPVRVGWASAPGRFVEALIREQLALLDSHQDQCWELPAPWNDPTYTPQV
ncbi:hypothetical protein P43SY_010787 [Pythium insidiosum]|uniref:Uncharacterized protein n=1 Tax=Pythium insidiosum TaxID=114742 RepID=A0AAD5Q1M7_PYTIN|nr:hypothetical protein P43SY_010787 [Pythium insidiosum]